MRPSGGRAVLPPVPLLRARDLLCIAAPVLLACSASTPKPSVSVPDGGAFDAPLTDAPDGGEDTTVIVSPPPPCTPLPGPSAPPVGSLDAATDQVSAGWAKDPDWDGPIPVHLYFDDRLADVTGADLPREDLDGNHAFHRPHAPFGAGTHQVKAFAIGVDASGCPDGGNVLIGGPTFVTPSCDAVSELYRGWCTAVPHYWRDKFQDTVRLISPNLVAGVNLSYGGTLFELYGPDRAHNLINEQGGAAVQLSIWAYGANGEHRGTALPGKGTYCEGSLGPDWATKPLDAPYNPIQAQQTNCSWAEAEDASNDVDGWHIENGTLVAQLNDPIHYTGSLPMPGVQFREEVSLGGDAYVKLVYRVANFSTVPITDPHPQEAPAIFLDLGPGANLYFYGGAAPWTGASVESRPMTAATRLSFLGRDITPADGAQGGAMAEGWYSVCSLDETHCVTIATPLDPASHVWEAAVSPDAGSRNVYATLLSYYALTPNSTHDVTVYLFPFKYDAVVGGKPVRGWICELAGQDC